MGAELLCLPQDSGAGRLSFYRKLCYGIGGVPNQVASSAIAFYLQLFLLDVAQVSVGSSLGVPYSHVWCLGCSAQRTSSAGTVNWSTSVWPLQHGSRWQPRACRGRVAVTRRKPMA